VRSKVEIRDIVAGLDPRATRNLDEMILGTCERYKVTSVAISHVMASMVRVADRIAMPAGGPA
jgi:ABC-type transporter Mla maintaining outer membrane lipid asymmetry ATPase subunit MlaF